MATNEQIALVLALIDNSLLFIVFLLRGFGLLLSNGRLIDFWSIWLLQFSRPAQVKAKPTIAAEHVYAFLKEVRRQGPGPATGAQASCWHS